MCRCPSMNPGMAVMPLASMVRPLAALGPPGAIETIFPARTTIDPRSITEPLGPMILALAIVRSCAESDVSAPNARQVSIVKVYCFILILSPRQMTKQYLSQRLELAANYANFANFGVVRAIGG